MSNITSSTPRMRHLQPLNINTKERRPGKLEQKQAREELRGNKATFQDRRADNNKAKNNLRYLAKRETCIYLGP